MIASRHVYVRGVHHKETALKIMSGIESTKLHKVLRIISLNWRGEDNLIGLAFVTRIRGFFAIAWPDLMYIANVPAHIASDAETTMASSFWADMGCK